MCCRLQIAGRKVLAVWIDCRRTVREVQHAENGHPELKDYVIVRRAKLELHLFHWPQLDTQTTFAGAYLRVKDVDELYEAFSTARLPARGTPSMAGIKRRAWGMREFNLVDCSGNLLRVGEPIPKSAKGMAG